MVAPAEPEAVFELADEGTQASGQESPLAEVGESIPEPLAPQPDIPPGRPAAPVTVEQAIEEVGNIVESLRGSLEEMEEVMELLEMFERQKTADEREIESLRRALRQMHRPRDPGRHPHR